MFRLRLIHLLYAFIIPALAFFNLLPVSAANNGGIEVTQTRIIFDAEQDQGKCLQFGIVNNGSEDMSVKIEKADYFISDSGAFQVKEAGTMQNSAASFLLCEEPELTMKPGDQLTIDVTLRTEMKYILPEYLSAILVRYIPKSVSESKANIKTYTQVAVTVRVLSGNLMKESIDTSSPSLKFIKLMGSRFIGYGGKKDIKLALKNNGLMTIEPVINAEVDSIFSGRIEELPIVKGYIMPDQTRTFDITVNSTSVFDIRTISLHYSYNYADAEFEDKCSYTYIVLSYQLMIGIILLIAGIIWQTRLFKKKNKLLKQLVEQNKAMAEAAATSVPSGGENQQSAKTTTSESATQSEHIKEEH